MKTQRFREFFARLFGPVRVFTLLILVILIYLLPFNSKPEFIQYNRQIVEVPNNSPILKSLYPEGAFATCGDGGTGTNCHTGCCSAGACVVCPPRENEDRPPNIAATLNCPQPGANNWCLGSLSINLSASDPQGYAVLISGTFAGNPFACPVGNTTCSIPVTTEGQGTISYRVDSSSGLFDSDTTSYKLDLTTPEMNGSISGATGNNNWYRSNAVLEINASDSISGIASITTTLDGGSPTAYTSPITLTDGIYSVLVTASDQAGNTTQITQTVQVDTLNPSINVALGGTKGSNDWYVSTASITPSAADSGSGIASFEISVDGGAWTAVTGSSSLPDGIHTYKLRATDNAGNSTETPEQTIQVDTIAPFIDMTDKLNLGGTVYYNVEDYGSGLAQYRAVIEDDEERYQKVVWLEQLYENQFDGQIRWDGRFKDGTFAGTGEYFITLKITDAAGNETIKSAIVQVNPLSILQDIPAFTPPTTVENIPEEEDSPTTRTETNSLTEVTPSETSFGGESNPFAEGSFVSTVFGVPATTTPIAEIPLDSAILWGAAATALVGFTVGNWEKDRERERRAKEKALLQKRANTERRKKQKEYEDSVRERWRREKEARIAIEEEKKRKEKERQNAVYAARRATFKEAEAAIEEQALKNKERINAIDEMRSTERATMVEQAQVQQAQKNKPSKVDNLWNLAYKNQTDLSLGTGIVAGLVAAGLILGGAAISPLLLIGGAVVLTAAVVTAGTIALNHHFEQKWSDNLGNNLLAGTLPALLLPVGAVLLAPALPWISTTATGLCVQYCSQIGNAIDFAEEAMLSTQLAYYNWTGNQDQFASTYIELQLEKADGSTPGNSFAIEATEQIAKLGPDAMELAGKYGIDAISLMLKYGDDAVDIIGAYDDEGLSLLLLYGEDAVKTIKKYGTPGVDLMTTYGDDAVSALSGNVTSVKNSHIEEMTSALKTMDPDLRIWYSELTSQMYVSKSTDLAIDASKLLNTTSDKSMLIKDIAKGSTRGSGNRVVLGPYEEGGGYIGEAIENGGIFFDTGDEVWDQIEGNIDTWLVNEQFLKNQLESGVERFDFIGVDVDDLLDPTKVWDKKPSRVLEVEFIQENAKDYGYIRIGNSWVKK